MSTPEDQPKQSPLPKACENCRIRKIRCNRANPCSNCTSSGIECRPSSKPTESRPRMIVSNHYEKQIERIHERLIGIELALRSFSISQSSSTPQSHTSLPASTTVSTATPSQFEGDSSFQSQTIRASEVARSLDVNHDQDLSFALESLRDIEKISLSSVHHVHFSSIEDRPRGPQMELLPADFVIKVLTKIKAKFPACFLHLALSYDVQLERLCQRAYFPTEQMSLGEMTTMYGMLWLVIQEYLAMNDPISLEFDLKRYADVCAKNLHAGVETYDLLVDPTFDNAFALMIAASKAQDEGKIILCWTLASAAARQLQALGYHREATFINDDPILADRKRHLFWSVYSLEKNMALSLGRASSFQDWDTDVKIFKMPSDPSIRPWIVGAVIFIKLARVQGQIYEQLYSISAKNKSKEERSKIIDRLARSLDQIYKEFRHVEKSKALYVDMYEMFYEASDVIYFSLQTMLYRAVSNPNEGAEISSKCFEAAKNCLRCHLHYFPRFASQGEAMISGYINWVLLYCSFTPFIVVFLHAIGSMNTADVQLLTDMTESLEPVHNISPVLNRLYNTCRVFSHVAEALVRAKDQPQPGSATALGTYDQQRDALLFPGFTGHAAFDPHHLPDIFMQGNPMDTSGFNFDDMSAYFGNWVGSNQPVMDLFNMDFGNVQ